MTLTPATIREYDRAAPNRDETETATFALGCFWGPDAQFGALRGVVRTRVGYAGGTKSDPTYHDLGDHTEVFQVDFTTDEISYLDLLNTAFQNYSPRRQSPKVQYQNIVFTATAEQRETLEEYLRSKGHAADDIATRIERIEQFTLAEDYHQKHSLRSRPALMDPFEAVDDDALRESPAAAKLNGYASGHDLPETDDLAAALTGTTHARR